MRVAPPTVRRGGRAPHVVAPAVIALALVALSACSSSTGSGSPDSIGFGRYEASTSIDTEITGGWSEATLVKVPAITDEVVVKEGVLLDGQYWAMDAEIDASGDLIFSIARVRFGAVCEQWAKEQGRGDVGCLNDYAVDTTLTAWVPARDALKVSVVSVSDQARRYDISEEAMVQLLAGDTSGSPRDFDFAPFPYVVTVLNGTVLTADQVWVP